MGARRTFAGISVLDGVRMCKLKIRCVSSYPYVLYVTYLALHCPIMRNYYWKESAGARKIYGACSGSQLPVFTVKSTGSLYSVAVCGRGHRGPTCGPTLHRFAIVLHSSR